MNKTIIPTILSLIALAVIMIAAQTAYSQGAVDGYLAGSSTGANGSAVSKIIGTDKANELSVILTAAGGNFGSKFGLVSVSVDGSTFIQVDNFTLSTNTLVAKVYNSSALIADVPVNPAVFPFVKIATSAGNTNVVETISFVLKR